MPEMIEAPCYNSECSGILKGECGGDFFVKDLGRHIQILNGYCPTCEGSWREL